MAAVENMFDPVHYKTVRLAPLEAETLPSWCYTTQEFYDREIDRIFKKEWNFICREDEVSNPGDYLALEVFGDPIVILRDREGTLRAFANICRHRGTRLLRGSGNCNVISCPYHSWTYMLNGDLIGTPGMEQTVNFDKKQYGLIPIRLETWDGFVFISFNEHAPGLMEYLGELPEKLASHNLSNMVCVRRKEYDVACNWKLFLENAAEGYHTATVHKTSIGKQTGFKVDGSGEWDGGFMPQETTAALLTEDMDSAFPPIPTLDEMVAGGTYFVVLYPSTYLVATQDCAWWLQEFPIAPNRTRIVIGSCFPRETVAREDFSKKVEKYYERWDKSLPEDNAISEQQQIGLSSSASRVGRLSYEEPEVGEIANWLLDRVLD